MAIGELLPSVGIDIGLVFAVGRDLMAAMRMAGQVDDPHMVPVVQQHEGHVGVGLRLDLDTTGAGGIATFLRAIGDHALPIPSGALQQGRLPVWRQCEVVYPVGVGKTRCQRRQSSRQRGQCRMEGLIDTRITKAW